MCAIPLVQGGFEAAKGFHRDFDSWAESRVASASGRGKKSGSGVADDKAQRAAPCVGEYTPIRPVEDAAVLVRVLPVACRAGDLVCWDNRIPHANSRGNCAETAREVSLPKNSH